MRCPLPHSQCPSPCGARGARGAQDTYPLARASVPTDVLHADGVLPGPLPPEPERAGGPEHAAAGEHRDGEGLRELRDGPAVRAAQLRRADAAGDARGLQRDAALLADGADAVLQPHALHAGRHLGAGATGPRALWGSSTACLEMPTGPRQGVEASVACPSACPSARAATSLTNTACPRHRDRRRGEAHNA